MENIKLNNQYIYTMEKKGRKLFYNNINGKLAIAEKIQDFGKDFYEPAQDINIDLDGDGRPDINIDLKQIMRHGHNFKDYICSDSIMFKSDYFEIDEKVGRVLFMKEYATFIDDGMIAKLTDISKNMMLSIDILPIPTEEALKEIQNKMLAVETDITRWQRKQNENYNFSAMIPYEMRQMREESEEFLDDLTTKDERMMFALVTIVHTADDID